MSVIFISHDSSDNAIAEDLRQRLKDQGHQSIYLDFDEQDGTAAGQLWQRDLFRKIKNCEAVIAIVTENSMASKWCFAEYTHAYMEGKPVFPVIAGDCEVNSTLTQSQMIDVRDSENAEWGKLWNGLIQAGIDPSESFQWDRSRPPYPGLSAFQEADAAVYCGRDKEIRSALEEFRKARLEPRPRPRILVGPSGSGKSSLIRAGVLPRLKRTPEKWIVTEPFRPTSHPFRNLYRTLDQALENICIAHSGNLESERQENKEYGNRDSARTHAQEIVRRIEQLGRISKNREATTILVIDQLEELITANERRTALLFLESIKLAWGETEALLIAATMRSDFLGLFQQLAIDGDLDYLTLEIKPISHDQIMGVIERPANIGNLTLESGLPERIAADVRNAEFALPLLAFCLRQLYEEGGEDRILEISEYEAMGGLKGAIGKAADKIFKSASLTEKQMSLAQAAFIDLVKVNEQKRRIRRRTSWQDIPPDDAVHKLLTEFVDARLLVSSGEGSETRLEVAHESIFEAWAQYREWIEQDSAFLLWRNRLRAAIESAGDGDYLRGELLGESRSWYQRNGARLDEDERLFIQRSIERKLASKKIRRIGTVVSTVFLLGVIGVVSYLGRLAKLEGEEANNQKVLAISARVLKSDPSKAASLLLSLGREFQSPYFRRLMREALGFRFTEYEFGGHESPLNLAQVSQDGEYFLSATAGEIGQIRVWDRGSSQPLVDIVGSEVLERKQKYKETRSNVISAEIDPNSRWIATCGSDGELRIHTIIGEKVQTGLLGFGKCLGAKYSPAGKVLAVADGSKDDDPNYKNRIRLFLSDRIEEEYHSILLKGEPKDFAFSGDGRKILAISSYDIADTGYLTVEEIHSASPDTLEGNSASRLPVKGLTKNSRLISSYDGNYAVVTLCDRNLAVYSSLNATVDYIRAGHTNTGADIPEPDCGDSNNVESSILASAFSQENELLAVTRSGTLIRWARNSHGLRSENSAARYNVKQTVSLGMDISKASFNGDSSEILFVPANEKKNHRGYIKSTSSGKTLSVLKGHSANILSVDYDIPRNRPVTTSEDGTVRLWLAANTLEPMTIGSDEHPVSHAAFSPDGLTLVTSGDKGIREWTLGEEVKKPRFFTQERTGAISISSDGSKIAYENYSADKNKQGVFVAPLLDSHPDSAAAPYKVASHTGHSDLFFSGSDKSVYSSTMAAAASNSISDYCSENFPPSIGTKEKWDVKSLGGMRFYPIDPNESESYLSPTAVDQALAGRTLSDRQRGELIAIKRKIIESEERDPVFVMSGDIASDGSESIITTAEDGPAIHERNRRGHSIKLVPTFTRIGVARFSPNRERIVTGDCSGLLQIWQRPDNSAPKEMSGLEATEEAQTSVVDQLRANIGAIADAKFSPDNKEIVAVGSSGLAVAWNLTGTTEPEILTLEDGAIQKANYHPNSNFVLTISDDQRAQIWSLDTQVLYDAIKIAQPVCVDAEMRHKLLGLEKQQAESELERCLEMRQEGGGLINRSWKAPGYGSQASYDSAYSRDNSPSETP